VEALRPLLERWATVRRAEELLCDFHQRLLVLRAVRSTVTGRELPTFEQFALAVAP
jgi:hypothetical protein